MKLKQLLKIAFDCGYDTSVMYNCGDGDAHKDFESFYRSEIKQLTLTNVSQQRELLAFVKEVAEWDKEYSSTNLKLKAKEILKANCG